jgi:hypothetical protein
MCVRTQQCLPELVQMGTQRPMLHATVHKSHQQNHVSMCCMCADRRSERAAAALAAGGALGGLGKASWELQWVTPDEQGRVEEAGEAHLVSFHDNVLLCY